MIDAEGWYHPMWRAWALRQRLDPVSLQGYTGGETHFPRLNITIPAKRGSALIWPSVLDGDPNERDDRTDHEVRCPSEDLLLKKPF